MSYVVSGKFDGISKASSGFGTGVYPCSSSSERLSELQLIFIKINM